LLSTVPSRAQDAAAVEIKNTLTGWMADFNAGKTERVYDLFATDVRADFRGHPTRDHKAVCDLLTKSLTDPSRVYRYALDIKEILVFGDVALVRLV
jgi:steroid delta-isomerase